MLHYKAVAKTRAEKIGDILLGIFGMAAMIYTTAQTIKVSLDHFFDNAEPGADMLCAVDGRT
jgi:proton-coupled amino acid transporter